ncbi:MAG: ABC transporter ATP-binding protein, partial [Pseudomonadota bacterium]
MLNRLLTWFESLIEPFPQEEPTQPPEGLLAFMWHYSKPVWPLLLLITILSGVVGLLEVTLFAFLGNVVGWLSEADRETFLADEGTTLIVMAVVVLVALPIIHIIWSLLFHQTLLGNYPMRIRWQAHRYLLGQSMSFY